MKWFGSHLKEEADIIKSQSLACQKNEYLIE